MRKDYKVSIRQYTGTGSRSYWVGTQIIFSGKDGAHFYELIKTKRLDWSLLRLDGHRLSLGRIGLCFSRPNDSSHTIKLFDEFLVNSRKQIQDKTNTRYIKLQDSTNGKILKVNRRNNSVHYIIYKKDQKVRFEIELKHQQTKLVQDYLFNNRLDIFEHELITQYFKYSARVLHLGYTYSDWIVDFQRRRKIIYTSHSLVTSYLETVVNNPKEEGERLFQFLYFVKSLKLQPFNNSKRHRIKDQYYYILRFPLSKFMKFTGIRISKQSQRNTLIHYFRQLQRYCKRIF